MYDQYFNPPAKQYEDFEIERLRENVTFWKDKVDSLLKEKSEGLLEKMSGHKTIRDLEQSIE